MNRAKVGDRAGAIRNADKDTVWLFGYGVMIPGEIPEADVPGVWAQMHRDIGEPALVTILLDSGVKVHGFECWQNTEDVIRRIIGDRAVILVEPERIKPE